MFRTANRTSGSASIIMLPFPYNRLLPMFRTVEAVEVETELSASVSASSSPTAAHSVVKAGGESRVCTNSFFASGESTGGAAAGALVSYSTAPFEVGVEFVLVSTNSAGPALGTELEGSLWAP